MGHYKVEVLWERGDQAFVDNRYSRRHRLRFDGGVEVPASSSPDVVPPPMSDASAVDPEEAFVASLSSCHMLWFLSLAAQRKLRVDSYFDAADGLLKQNAEGKLAMTQVTLRPKVAFSGDRTSHPRGDRPAPPRGARGVLPGQLGQDRDALRAGLRLNAAGLRESSGTSPQALSEP